MAEGEEMLVIAKYDYTAENGQELSIKKSERLTLLDNSKDWWRVKNSDNKQGYVPSNYVKMSKPKSIFSSLLKKGNKVKKNDKVPQPQQKSPSCPSPSLNGNTRPRGDQLDNAPVTTNQLAQFLPAHAKYNYTAQRPDELSLIKAERIMVMEKSSDGWWKGQKDDTTAGWFPSNYVEVDSGGDQDNVLYSTAAGADSAGGSQPEMPEHVLALYTFAGTNAGELPFEKGEKLDVVSASDEDPDWWQARNSRGEQGLIPRNYVTPTAPQGDQESDRTTSTTSSSTPHSQSISSISNTSLPGVVGRRQFHVSGPLAERDWYYGKITRQQCEEILTRHADNGDFLIRDSESTVGHYTVVLKAPNRNKHFRVKVTDGVYEIGQQKFNNLEELIEHYKKHPIFKQDTEKLYLIKPFNFPSPSSSDNF
ncbi:hypothetical protein V1264_010454 [Littorina saxatilis]|uniref:Uncharacterized protein n=2 Tax=Littorina saxatilis TaxID=31220 RepID=A0AAN9G0X2_9CAEN